MGHRWSLLLAIVPCLFLARNNAGAQQVIGQVFDASTGLPINTAGVFLRSQDGSRQAVAIADSLGRYILDAPAGGSYVIFSQRLGYYDTESPLFVLSSGSTYSVDLELRPEPITLDPLLVSVGNVEMERWLTLRLGGNPNALLGYRAIQGLELEEAKLRSEDNTELLRWLYIPVSHGIDMCVGSRMPDIDRLTGQVGPAACGKLYLDGRLVPIEHVDGIDMESISVVVTFQEPLSVHLFTRTFDWTERPSG
jgi:carboxypeptidase family protein